MKNEYKNYFGKLGKKPEIRYTPKQTPVCDFTIAIYQGKEQEPVWKKIVVWGKQAEQCSVLLDKGHDIFVQGREEDKEFTNEEGKLIKYTEVNARKLGFVYA